MTSQTPPTTYDQRKQRLNGIPLNERQLEKLQENKIRRDQELGKHPQEKPNDKR